VPLDDDDKASFKFSDKLERMYVKDVATKEEITVLCREISLNRNTGQGRQQANKV
jgi:hypothetical protein